MSRGEMKMNEQQVNEMIDLLRRSANQLRELQNTMGNIAKQIEGGALLGQAGNQFTAALNGNMNPALDRLAMKLEERARYVEKERDELKRAMGESGQLYG